MKAVLIKNNTGPASSLYIGEAPKPHRKTPDDVLIKVKYFGLNRMDLLQREGNYPLPSGASTILGVEFSGVIEEVPENNTDDSNRNAGCWKKGEQVFGLTTGGAYAEYVVCNKATLFKMPDSLPFDLATAAAIPEVWLTATQVVRLIGKLEANESLLFHAGASGVGIAAIQIAQVLGASQVFATVGSEKKQDFVQSLKVKVQGNQTEIVPINYKTQDFAKVIKEKGKKLDANNQGTVDVVVDTVAGSYFKRNLQLLAKYGRYVLMGLMGGDIINGETQQGSINYSAVDISPILYKALRIEGTTLRARDATYKAALKKEFLEKVYPHLVAGEFTILIEKEFDWTDIQKAHELMESNSTMGKIIVRVS